MPKHSLLPTNWTEDGLVPFSWLRREIDKFFDDMGRPSHLFSHSTNENFFQLMPVIDVEETERSIAVTAELPGLEAKDIKIEVKNDILRIRGEKKLNHEEKGKNFHRIERMSGVFDRQVLLPCGIDEAQADATFKNGVLIVTLPKSTESQKDIKRIEIKKG